MLDLDGNLALTGFLPIPRAGDRIGGKYRLQAEIGCGGFGRVFAAQNENLQQPVAIKVLREPGPNEQLWKEARAAARLRGPHCVRVFDVDRLNCGSPYVVMELLEGETLKRLLKRSGPVPPARAIRWARQLCAALSEAHSVRLIHGDVKPSNVFIESTWGASHVKLVDFGLARKLAPTGDETESRSGVVRGSPAYMSPEQVRGDAVSFVSDVWSLGVVLFEMLSGRRPFRGGNSSALFAAIAADPPISLHEAAPGVPPRLVEIVHRCLRKAPNERFQSVADVDAALASLAPGESHADGAAATSIDETTASHTLATPTAARASGSPLAVSLRAGERSIGDEQLPVSPLVAPAKPRSHVRSSRMQPSIVAIAIASLAVVGSSWHVSTESRRLPASTEDRSEAALVSPRPSSSNLTRGVHAVPARRIAPLRQHVAASVASAPTGRRVPPSPTVGQRAATPLPRKSRPATRPLEASPAPEAGPSHVDSAATPHVPAAHGSGAKPPTLFAEPDF